MLSAGSRRLCLCAFAATVLRNFASYAAALAGTTAAIIAAANLGATGGASPDVILVAINRASEICVAVPGIKNRLAGSQSREAIGLTGGWTLWHSTMTIVTASIVVTHSAA